MKKIYAFCLLFIAIVGVLFFIHQENDGFQEDETIRIGVVGPLSGVLARFGEWTFRGADIAAEEINMQGGIGGKQIELIVEDDQCSGTKAVSAVQKIQDVDKAHLILSFCTITSSAIAPVTKDTSLVLAPTFKLPQLVEKDFPHYIALQPSMYFEVSKLFEYIESQNFKTIGVLYTTNDFWTAYKDALIQIAEERGVEIVAVEEADFLATDFRTQLSKLAASDPDVIFGGLNPGPLGTMMRQTSELLIEAPVVSVWATQAPDLLDTAGDTADGIVYTYYYENGFTEENDIYRDIYVSRYREEPELISASAYDILYIFKHVVEVCGEEDIECMIQEIEHIENFEGASGILTFENGSTIKDTFFKTVQGGEFVRLE